jgi:hypothetical protein
MYNTDQVTNTSSRKHALIIVAIFELYFVYSYVISFFLTNTSPYSFWWITALVKIGLGYLTYKLYTSQNKIWAILGAGLTVAVIVTTTIISSISPNVLSPVFGGVLFFLLPANTLFLYRYCKNREAIKLHMNKYYIVVEIFLLLNLLLSILNYSGRGIFQWGSLLYWILFYLETEGFYKPNNKYA